MANENPYRPPQSDAPESDSVPQVDAGPPPQRMMLLLGASIVATVTTAFAPYLAIPMAFLLTPAFSRAWRLNVLGKQRSQGFAVLVISSFLYAIPSAVASSVAFCCVCFPGGYVGANMLVLRTSAGYFAIFAAGALLIFASTFLALWAGEVVLRHNKYFIQKDVE